MMIDMTKQLKYEYFDTLILYMSMSSNAYFIFAHSQNLKFI